MTPLPMWPRPRPLTLADLLGRPCASHDVEARLRTLFPGAEAVLFSSARAGLTATLQALGLSRPHLFWTPGFSSHCVLEAVAHVCTPTPVATQDLRGALVHHQWGFAQHAAFDAAVILVEDAVDTLLMPGCDLFIAGGRVTLWSPPKVLGTQGGGVVFCRSPEFAQSLRTLRASRPSSLLQSMLRQRASSSRRASAYWNGAEALQGELPAPQRRQLMRALGRLPALVDERLAVLRAAWPAMAAQLEASGRLPSNLPLRVPEHWQRVWNGAGGVWSDLRSFGANRACPGTDWVKVAPLPVHADVGPRELQHVFERLDIREGHELQIV